MNTSALGVERSTSPSPGTSGRLTPRGGAGAPHVRRLRARNRRTEGWAWHGWYTRVSTEGWSSWRKEGKEWWAGEGGGLYASFLPRERTDPSSVCQAECLPLDGSSQGLQTSEAPTPRALECLVGSERVSLMTCSIILDCFKDVCSLVYLGSGLVPEDDKRVKNSKGNFPCVFQGLFNRKYVLLPATETKCSRCIGHRFSVMRKTHHWHHAKSKE